MLTFRCCYFRCWYCCWFSISEHISRSLSHLQPLLCAYAKSEIFVRNEQRKKRKKEKNHPTELTIVEECVVYHNRPTPCLVSYSIFSVFQGKSISYTKLKQIILCLASFYMHIKKKRLCTLYFVIFVGGFVSPLTITFSTLTARFQTQNDEMKRKKKTNETMKHTNQI